MATTTNYSWTTPDDTALVKDGAAAIRSLGTAIDSTVFTNAGAAVTKATVDAKGDLIAGTADNTVARLAVGANDTVLTADSSTATGLKWAAPVASGTSWTLLNSGGTTLTGASTITVSGISAKNQLMVIIEDASSVNNGFGCDIRLNTDSGANYIAHGAMVRNLATDGSNCRMQGVSETGRSEIRLGSNGQASQSFNGSIFFDGCNTSGVKSFFSLGGGAFSTTNSGSEGIFQGGYWNNSATVTSVSVLSSTGNFDGGKIYVYTSAS